MNIRKKGIIQIFTSVLLFLVSWWALLWVFSSTSLTVTVCDSYSLLHEEFRCRQPYIAQILWIVSGILSMIFFPLGFANIRRSNKAE